MKVFTFLGIALLLFFGATSCTSNNSNRGTITASVDTTAKGDPFILEVVDANVDTALLAKVCEKNGLGRSDIYRWKDHYVIYAVSSNLEALQQNIRSVLPGVITKAYPDPFYVFNRVRCSDTVSAREWDHVILTANLVKDSSLQNEYVTYHATQFREWPEVSNGFCNANFQQLLLFRNGRQLMLVISIPKGSSLDELNPKTTENNPRVDEWNALMKKYQEGIAGTGVGEVWVELKRY